MFLIKDPAKYYHRVFGKLRTEVIDGDKVFTDLAEWQNYPYKYEIMNQVLELQNTFYKKANSWWPYPYIRADFGLYPYCTKTPIYAGDIYNINTFIEHFGKGVRNEPHYGIIPESLIRTKLGYTIYQELVDAIPTYGKYVFCHTCLRYDSFIIREHRLVGILNWDYAGFYPSEFDRIIRKYLESI